MPGELSAALRRRLEARGGRLVCQAPVSKIVVSRWPGRGCGVLGQQVRVRRAVLADVGAEQLYGGLVSTDELPRRVTRRMQEFRRDPATFKIDYALPGPCPGLRRPPYAPGTVHIADSYADIITYFGHLAAGTDPRPAVPADRSDDHHRPTRSPAGTESLWVYTHVPQQVERRRRRVD